MDRMLERLAAPKVTRHGASLTTRDIGRDEIGAAIEPFIFVSLYDMAGPVFPPHPHAGFSVATYILPESPIGFVNHDSLGHRNRIAPGALHITVAGSGVIHEEQPERPGALARGFQIWLDHRRADREIEPRAMHVRAEAMPLAQWEGGSARVVLGTAYDQTASVTPPTAATILDVTLDPGARFEAAIPPDHNVFLVMLDGSVGTGGQTVADGELGVFARGGGAVVVEAGGGGARFTLFSGQPHGGPALQQGPFVASDIEQLARMTANYHGGKFGRLAPFAAHSDWAPNDGQEIAR